LQTAQRFLGQWLSLGQSDCDLRKPTKLFSIARDCKLGRAVQIEPSLRPPSPKNGNFSNVRRRLPAILVGKCRKPEPGDWCLIRKSPPLAGFSAGKRDIFSEFRTGWLTWEDSNFHIPI
jgi:hypothetical protein